MDSLGPLRMRSKRLCHKELKIQKVHKVKSHCHPEFISALKDCLRGKSSYFFNFNTMEGESIKEHSDTKPKKPKILTIQG
jgi:hypothetical protein